MSVFGVNEGVFYLSYGGQAVSPHALSLRCSLQTEAPLKVMAVYRTAIQDVQSTCDSIATPVGYTCNKRCTVGST